MLVVEADVICNAKKYDHVSERNDTRAGHYELKLHTNAGEVQLKVPE